MVRVGWLHDDVGVIGGAELTRDILMSAAPEGTENVLCPPNKRPLDIDVFVVGNCVFYHERWIEELSRKPVVKHVHDLWPYGSPVLRRWLLDNAALLLFNSPKQLSLFRFSAAAPYDFLPPPVDMGRFQEAAARAGDREGTVWFGNVSANKGIQYVVDWALRTGTSVDVYGPCYEPLTREQIVPPCSYLGPLTQDELPETLARYERYVHMPSKSDVCGRAAVEAWATGLELFFGGNADEDAFWGWLDIVTAKGFQNAPTNFWKKVFNALNGGLEWST